jgi:hypothetical protein
VGRGILTQIKLEALWVRSDLGIIYSYRRKKKKGAPQRTPNPNRETNQQAACEEHSSHSANTGMRVWLRLKEIY